MPWIDLQLDDPAQGTTVASALAGAVAEALELGPDDVLVSVRRRAIVVDGQGPVVGWPAATLHGCPRDPSLMERASRAAATVLASAHAIPETRVWVHWCTG
jgi:hypothetical protein